ncbi:MAG: ribosomal protein S18-alanine N-acetyltransferase [Candidatus Hadarchaeales archaeon]
MEAERRFSVREAEERDLKAILDIEYMCFPDPYPLSLLNRLLSMYRSTFLVVEDDGGGVVGYVIGAVKWGKVGHVLAIGVNPSHRRKKIGSALMKEVLARFAKKGAEIAKLEVRKSNIGAREFYKKLGFLERYEIPYYYVDGETAVTMEKNLIV